ncbi:MAG TPA: class I SAM-dependent methyltransferase [Verrucomicrobiae bacterium]
MKNLIKLLGLLNLACWFGLDAQSAPVVSSANQSIAYVATHHDIVADMLWMAGVGPKDVVYDLGAGDGRVVIAAVRDFHAARAVGIESNTQLVRQSRENAKRDGVSERVEFLEGDLFTNDVSSASVVVLYLGHGANLDLRAKLLQKLKPDARIISHQFGMGEWLPDKTLDVRTPVLGMYGEMVNRFATNTDVPGYDALPTRRLHDTVCEWIVPAPLAGTWRGQLKTGDASGELKMVLHQRIAGVSGFFEITGSTNLSGGISADLWGSHLRLHFSSTNPPYGQFQMWFAGDAKGDTLNGIVQMSLNNGAPEFALVAHRERKDFTGIWEWRAHNGRPVQLTIERTNGVYSAMYFDRERDVSPWHRVAKPAPVFDFYDFGGGFYFTCLLGMEGPRFMSSATRMGPEDGWLVGEAVTSGEALAGNIAFYPYHLDSFFGKPDSAPPPKPPIIEGRQEWMPKRIKP